MLTFAFAHVARVIRLCHVSRVSHSTTQDTAWAREAHLSPSPSRYIAHASAASDAFPERSISPIRSAATSATEWRQSAARWARATDMAFA